VEERPVATAILAVAEEQAADLILIGAAQHNGPRVHMHADLASHLIHRAACPVMSIPAEMADR
jgi:nucleotide-binding universal stress UspA family protein